MKNNIRIVYSIFYMKIFLIFISINSIFNYCNISEPILLPDRNLCVMQYCPKEDFESNKCKVDNDIIRTQWLNNIIEFGGENCRFSKVAKYSNGDIVSIANNDKEGPLKSYFFGLKENGRPLFIKDDKEQSYKVLSNNETNLYKNYEEGEILTTKIGTLDEEYLLNIQRLDYTADLYDLKKDKIYSTFSYSFFLNKIEYLIILLHNT